MTDFQTLNTATLKTGDAQFPVEELIGNWLTHRDSRWAGAQFRTNVYDLIKRKPDQTVLEIGGGRSPMFSEQEIEEASAKYIINDISEKELSLAPPSFKKLCFDISAEGSDVVGRNSDTCSVIFSQMVFEHVSNALQAYKNIYTLLEPGGICVNYHPVLFSPPFVINFLLPEAISAIALRVLDKRRTETDIPKFPAHYDRCRISAKIRDELKEIGFAQVWQIPFFYTNYFMGVPIVRNLDNRLSRLAEQRKWNFLASYCYTCVVK